MRRPNVLLLYTDQQRWDALGANGNPDIHTPNLDRLAAEGINFDHCFVQNPVCMPSRVSFLSGQYPSTLGITHMGVPVPEDLPILPTLLAPYGYHTASIGKLHFLPHANRDHRVPHPRYGFDQLEISDEPGVYEDAYRAWVRRVAPDQLDHLSVGLPPATDVWYRQMGVRDTVRHPCEGGRFDFKGAIPFPGDERYTHTAFVAERTIAYLRQTDPRRPFVCIAGFYSPHSPWVAPQRFLDLYDPDRLALPSFPPEVDAQRTGEMYSDAQLRSARWGYYAMVSEVDHHVGRILGVLDECGLTDDTIVIFTSDHGEWLGEHLRYGKGVPAEDPVARVPMIVRWPKGVRRPGRTHSGLVEAVDLLPTLLDAAAVQIPPPLQGRSWLAQLDGSAEPVKDSALTEHTGWKILRTAGYRYILREGGREHLYDLSVQHGDYHDVAADPTYGSVLAEHRRLLLQRLLEMERPRPRIWPY